MKQIKVSLFLLLLIRSLYFVTSCNQIDPASVEIAAQAGIQLGISDEKEIICCVNCPTGCILSYEFDQTKQDPQHPQGSYVIKRIAGDCQCTIDGNGKYSTLTTGNAVVTTARWGGPRSTNPCNIGLGVNLA